MYVVGAGFARTGTMSTKVALDQLGFGPTYHFYEIFKHPDHVELWLAAGQGKPVDWNELFKGYNSTIDFPASIFYKKQMELYPEAKVLLNVRDPEKWYQSVANTIGVVGRDGSAAPPTINPERFALMNETNMWQGLFHGKFEDKAYAISVFERHIQEVKDYVPAEKLLVFDVQQGWEPLCRFLNVPVPDAPFPRLNDTEAFLQMAGGRRQGSGTA